MKIVKITEKISEEMCWSDEEVEGVVAVYICRDGEKEGKIVGVEMDDGKMKIVGCREDQEVKRWEEMEKWLEYGLN